VTPTTPSFSFIQSTQIVGAPINRIITRGAFAGLYALEQPMRVRIGANAANETRAAAGHALRHARRWWTAAG
jgi:hypothetical protein